MIPLEYLAAAVVLVLAVAVGTVAHEMAHGVVLWAIGVPFDLAWLPDRGDAGFLRAGLRGRWAAVTPRSIPDGVSPWQLRLAAVAPFALAIPFALVLVGVVPDPFAGIALVPKLAAIGWLACAIPSPQDFSLFWHPEAALAEFATGDDDR